MFKRVAFAMLFIMSIFTTTSAVVPDLNNTSIKSAKNPLEKDKTYVCVKWTGSSDPSQNRPSVCLVWKEKDCSQRLHKEICRAER